MIYRRDKRVVTARGYFYVAIYQRVSVFLLISDPPDIAGDRLVFDKFKYKPIYIYIYIEGVPV